MIPTFDSSYDFESANRRLKDLAQAIASRVRPVEQSVRVASESVLPRLHDVHGEVVYRVCEGCLHVRSGDKLVLMLEEGELAYLTASQLQLWSPDFSVAVDIYKVCDMQKEGGEVDAEWAALLAFQSEVWMSIASLMGHVGTHVLPRTRVYDPGEVIITEGEVAKEVFTLIEGEADVFVSDVRVGEVKTDEFFGILASITRGPRSATVKARTSCAVLCIDTERFQELIQVRPVLVEKLIGELARTIVDLNTRVVHLSTDKASSAL
jgi:CRP/FNR family cyclic AMP-dependent transcriptional regulator